MSRLACSRDKSCSQKLSVISLASFPVLVAKKNTFRRKPPNLRELLLLTPSNTEHLGKKWQLFSRRSGRAPLSSPAAVRDTPAHLHTFTQPCYLFQVAKWRIFIVRTRKQKGLFWTRHLLLRFIINSCMKNLPFLAFLTPN